VRQTAVVGWQVWGNPRRPPDQAERPLSDRSGDVRWSVQPRRPSADSGRPPDEIVGLESTRSGRAPSCHIGPPCSLFPVAAFQQTPAHRTDCGPFPTGNGVAAHAAGLPRCYCSSISWRSCCDHFRIKRVTAALGLLVVQCLPRERVSLFTYTKIVASKSRLLRIAEGLEPVDHHVLSDDLAPGFSHPSLGAAKIIFGKLAHQLAPVTPADREARYLAVPFNEAGLKSGSWRRHPR
jgi:hypothetical protein